MIFNEDIPSRFLTLYIVPHEARENRGEQKAVAIEAINQNIAATYGNLGNIIGK
jgi:hypothetical protein